METDLRSRLELILSAPTAPFFEGRVHSRLREVVRNSPRLRDRVDPCGNLEVVYGTGRPQLLFACHTDHPALVANGDGTATISGGIKVEQLKGAVLRMLDGDGAPLSVSRVGSAGAPGTVRLRGGRRLHKGTPLILDLPDLRITKRFIRARAIDDLCSVAVCLTAIDRLTKSRWKGTVGFLFTRAEEVGFAGALGWLETTRYPKSTTIVNLEMSSALPHTPPGQGPIVRVGDRITTFSHAVLLGLRTAAEAIRSRDPFFRYQRALMDGGACEATPFSQAGFATGALCLPLRNTHNHLPRGGMGLEQVHADDAENLVRLVVGYTRRFGRRDPTARVQKRLDSLWRTHRRRLQRSAREGEGT